MPQELLAKIEGLGYCLTLRFGGLRRTGEGEEPMPEVLILIGEHREALKSILEAEAKAWAASEASVAAGRMTIFPCNLLHFVHPSILESMTARSIVEPPGHFMRSI
ncbi:hypothetical protein [Holophaga foetida]|uniref:hypothetical protein n=1 Tax=Holophaga foetida TaxID=35839 RepID=UPI000247333D|nr:hypothetical protein [Holophaga foetida]